MSAKNSRASHEAMQQNATKCNSKNFAPKTAAAYVLASGQLSEKQRNAIELLLQGLSDVQVAQQIGVDRVTLYRWRTRSSQFRRELDRQRQVLWEQSRSRLQSMIQPALDILQKQIAGNDPKTALRAAAILLRYASPARLFDDGQKQSESSPALDLQMKQLDDFINAPLPGQTRRVGQHDDDDDEDDNDDV